VLATFVQEDMTITKTVLQDVVVLAVNEQTMRPPPRKQVATEEGAETKEEKAPATEQVKSATIAVTPHEAQILVLSAAQGSVHLALRARGDHDLAPLEASNEWALVGRRPPPPEPTPEAAAEEEKAKEEKAEAKIEEAKKEPEKPAGPPPPTVEVIRGNQREVVTMQKP
jgi:Flp pilus assembly protein CpaB